MKKRKMRSQQLSAGAIKQQRSKKRRKSKVLESLSGTDALAILEFLAERHASFAEAIDAVAGELLSEVDVEDIAADLSVSAHRFCGDRSPICRTK